MFAATTTLSRTMPLLLLITIAMLGECSPIQRIRRKRDLNAYMVVPNTGVPKGPWVNIAIGVCVYFAISVGLYIVTCCCCSVEKPTKHLAPVSIPGKVKSAKEKEETQKPQSTSAKHPTKQPVQSVPPLTGPTKPTILDGKQQTDIKISQPAELEPQRPTDRSKKPPRKSTHSARAPSSSSSSYTSSSYTPSSSGSWSSSPSGSTTSSGSSSESSSGSTTSSGSSSKSSSRSSHSRSSH